MEKNQTLKEMEAEYVKVHGKKKVYEYPAEEFFDKAFPKEFLMRVWEIGANKAEIARDTNTLFDVEFAFCKYLEETNDFPLDVRAPTIRACFCAGANSIEEQEFWCLKEKTT